MSKRKNNKFNINWEDENQVKEYHRQYRLKKKMNRLIERQKETQLFYSRLHNLPLVDIAYIAGLFDGEGCISISSGIWKRPGRANINIRTQHSLNVTIANQHTPTLNYNKDRTGLGNIYKDSPKRQNYKWCVSCSRAMEFLKVIKPYLKIKAPQAELAIKLQEMIGQRNIKLDNNPRLGKVVYLTEKELQERDKIRTEIMRLNHSYPLDKRIL